MKVRLFAVLREIADSSEVEVPDGDAPTVAAAVQAVCDRFGDRFTRVVERSTVVVDGEQSTLDTELTGGEEVAILPPVSGGAPRAKPALRQRVLLLVNPRARSYSPATVRVIAKAFGADFDVQLEETVGRGHGAERARAAVAEGFDMVVVLSGDGVINEVVNGLAGTDTALGVLPGGATNVLARNLGVPLDPMEAAESFIDLATASKARRIPLGSANDRYFVVNCGIGMDAAIMAKVERKAPSTRNSHEREAFFAAITEINRYVGKRDPHLTLRIDGTLELAAISVLIANIAPYAYFKSVGLKLHPDATLSEGLDVLAVKQLPRTSLPKVTYEMFLGGKLDSVRDVAYAHDVKTCEIAGVKPFPVQVDGEYVGEFDVLDVRLHPEALWVVA